MSPIQPNKGEISHRWSATRHKRTHGKDIGLEPVIILHEDPIWVRASEFGGISDAIARLDLIYGSSFRNQHD
jgi:hypothetical protein